MRTRLLRVTVALSTLSAGAPAWSCSDCEYEACVFTACACFPKSGCILPKPLDDLVTTLFPPPRLVISTIDRAVNDVAATVAKAFDDTVSTLDKAGKDIERNVDKAGKDAEGEIQRFGLELESAGRGIVKYVEGHKKIFTELDKAIQRTREGKIVDALWHAALAPIVVEEHSASEAVLESSYLRAVGQVAATAYGGPQGAAAYSAWLTYKQTGNPSLALRVGLITGASAWANGQAMQMPDAGKRALVAAAVGGTVVAASGGSEQAVREAFLQAGAMVVIQDQYQRYTTHEMNPQSSADVPAYCLSAVQTECTPLPEGAVVETDAAGNVIKVDMTKVDPAVPAVGKKDLTALFKESNPVMTGVSKIPGMQAMAVFHDLWAVDWNMGALATPTTIVPAMVLTYIGFGAPYYENVRTTAMERALAGTANPGRTEISSAARRGTDTESFIRFDGAGQVDRAITSYRRRADTPLWCGGPGGKHLYLQKKKVGALEIEIARCIRQKHGSPVFESPNWDFDAATLVTVVEGGKEVHICSSLFDRDGCAGAAERYAQQNASEKSVWYRAQGRAANEAKP